MFSSYRLVSLLKAHAPIDPAQGHDTVPTAQQEEATSHSDSDSIPQEHNSMPCMYINKDILHMPTFADGDLALRGLPAPAMLSLVPPIFSSPITRSLSSSGRLCRETVFETKCQNKQSLPLKAESRIQQYLF